MANITSAWALPETVPDVPWNPCERRGRMTQPLLPVCHQPKLSDLSLFPQNRASCQDLNNSDSLRFIIMMTTYEM